MTKIAPCPTQDHPPSDANLRLSIAARSRTGNAALLTFGPTAPASTVPPTNPPLQRDIARLDALLLRLLQPDEVLCWLFCDGYDACDVAERLSAAGFGGRLTICAPGLAAPDRVGRELRRAYPRLDLRLVAGAPLSPQAAAYHARIARAHETA